MQCSKGGRHEFRKRPTRVWSQMAHHEKCGKVHRSASTCAFGCSAAAAPIANHEFRMTNPMCARWVWSHIAPHEKRGITHRAPNRGGGTVGATQMRPHVKRDFADTAAWACT